MTMVLFYNKIFILSKMTKIKKIIFEVFYVSTGTKDESNKITINTSAYIEQSSYKFGLFKSILFLRSRWDKVFCFRTGNRRTEVHFEKVEKQLDVLKWSTIPRNFSWIYSVIWQKGVYNKKEKAPLQPL